MAFVPVPFVLPPIPVAFIGLPLARFSIAYDIYTNKNEDDAPNGWNSNRNYVYKHIANHFTAAGFTRDQYSDWIHPLTSAAHTFNTMVLLEMINPPHKFSSTVRWLRMSRMDIAATMDVSADMHLGGAFIQNLRAPVPAGLVAMAPAGAMLVPPPAPLPVGFPFVRPVDSKAGGASNAANYLF